MLGDGPIHLVHSSAQLVAIYRAQAEQCHEHEVPLLHEVRTLVVRTVHDEHFAGNVVGLFANELLLADLVLHVAIRVAPNENCFEVLMVHLVDLITSGLEHLHCWLGQLHCFSDLKVDKRMARMHGQLIRIVAQVTPLARLEPVRLLFRDDFLLFLAVHGIILFGDEVVFFLLDRLRLVVVVRDGDLHCWLECPIR